MKIGILGVGNIGKTLAQKFSAGGHDVKVANSRGPESIDAEVLKNGAAATTASEAVRDVDVVIISVPLNRIPDVVPVMSEAPRDALVIDTSNYYPMRDNKIEALEQGQVESVWVAEQLGRPVAKAWNSIGAKSFAINGTPAGTPNRIAIPVAADDPKDRQATMALVEETGFTAYDAGVLAESWRQQPGTPCYCTDVTEDEVEHALATADAARSPKRRELSVAVFAERYNDIMVTPEVDVAARVNRAIFM
ncbi:NADP oxidoreductase [Rhodococcus pyridinivorans KG-16]|uniref:NADP oxidoreductase n=2 Tax=Rhodococcus pyridinivorans TaxID=103816 RepID=A0A0V9UDS9_9NOCA|nr:NAD(P)-binding domain-containing protein [Rhodococcus pyridinivorans]KSZ56083.1 NADP oxidoreductase [Rhodococcus pyridinivorans KG-16]